MHNSNAAAPVAPAFAEGDLVTMPSQHGPVLALVVNDADGGADVFVTPVDSLGDLTARASYIPAVCLSLVAEAADVSPDAVLLAAALR